MAARPAQKSERRATLPLLGGGDAEIPGDAPLTLLLFFKASCPTCSWAMPYYAGFAEKHAGSKLRVLGVAEDDEETAAEFAKEHGVKFDVAIESAPWPVSAAWGLTTVPAMFLVDGTGEILMSSPGFSRDDLVEVARRAGELDGGEPVLAFPEGEDVPAFRPG